MARPTTRILTPGKIFRAALERFDERQEFSIPQLAKRLGVSPSSLYHHVKGGRTEIIEGIRSLISQDAHDRGDFPPGEGNWQEQTRRWAINYRYALGLHPMAIPALVGESVDDAPTLEIYETLAQILESAGFQDGRLLDALSLVDLLVLGSAIDAGSPEPPWEPSELAHPSLSRALATQTGARRQDRAFALGLDAVIAELDRQLTTHVAPDGLDRAIRRPAPASPHVSAKGSEIEEGANLL
ncbi:TetR/AcrR family transcriptional regulator C-terminal domain-containing protein [Arthrobacter sp. CAN_C5]|uniref:TetR/AcrR family transcriptional regulator C-terminal domain-containing protein n=1 Tax=Arthrobacter sp. CAN_C5 TaxID=2760706 RepID=UPI001AE7E4C8|nr:TetR/AcrR family transcriptional regulator C-terminal domain-containing protein [Arthrobacter sp. CAN_C5]MBP2215248.1 AcrR family transcriptional regulator [Arthrobacter sp. CAN_C5]